MQIRDDFADTSFKEKPAKWSPIVITSQREDRISRGLSFGPRYTKPSDLTPDSVCGDACSRQQSGSEKRKENRRKSIAEKANKHKWARFFISKLLKEKGRASYDWQTPLELLNKHSPKQYVDPPTGSEHPPWRHPEIRQIRADCISIPPVWSTYTFWLYIEKLTRSSVDHLIGRQLYGKGGSHTAEVSKILGKAFRAPSIREFLSPSAFNAAITFFCKNSEIPQAIALFEYMEWLRMEIPTETMNIMLLSAAMCKDLHTFTKILQKCTARGIVPDARSWTALLRAVWSRNAKWVVIQGMQDRKMLKVKRVMREVVKCIVRDEIVTHLDKDLDATLYLNWMDTRFGTNWLSVSVGNIILYELGQRKPATDAVGLLHIMMERGMIADEDTLNTLLLFCKRERDHLLAIRVLRLLHVETGVKINGRTLAHLFMQAWRSRLYNFARVVWRTACIRGVATFETLNFVRQSLLYHKSNVTSNEPGSRARIWHESAGEVIVGIKPVHDLDNFPPSSPATKATMMGRKDLKKLIDDDLATAGRYCLVDDFSDLLTNALKLDRTWMENGAWKGQSTEWKRKMGITVRVSEIASIPLGMVMYKSPSLSLSSPPHPRTHLETTVYPQT